MKREGESQISILKKRIFRLLLQSKVGPLCVIGAFTAFMLGLILVKVLSGPFNPDDTAGYLFLTTLFLAALIITWICTSDCRSFPKLAEQKPAKSRVKFGGTHAANGGSAEVTFPETGEKFVFQILRNTPGKLVEFPQLTEFDTYLLRNRDREQIILVRQEFLALGLRKIKEDQK